MPNEFSHLEHGLEVSGKEPEKESEKIQQETLARTLDHIQYASMERNNLPPEIGPAINLLCLAQESLIQAEQKKLMAHDNLRVREIGHLRDQAIHQIEKALQELKSQGRNNFIDGDTTYKNSESL
jgi:hypothetical protein